MFRIRRCESRGVLGRSWGDKWPWNRNELCLSWICKSTRSNFLIGFVFICSLEKLQRSFRGYVRKCFVLRVFISKLWKLFSRWSKKFAIVRFPESIVQNRVRTRRTEEKRDTFDSSKDREAFWAHWVGKFGVLRAQTWTKKPPKLLTHKFLTWKQNLVTSNFEKNYRMDIGTRLYHKPDDLVSRSEIF